MTIPPILPAAVLAVDTSTRWCAVGVCRTGGIPASGDMRVCAEVVVDGHRLHSERLFALIDRVLGDSGLSLGDISLLAVALGPGSFTGLRIGASALQGLALARGLPLVGVPTLEALSHVAAAARGTVVPLLDARMGEVFWAVFHAGPEGLVRTGEDRVGPVSRMMEELAPLRGDSVVFVGDGTDRYAGEILAAMPEARIVPPPGNTPRASHVAWEGWRRLAAGAAADPALAVPVYLRKAQAEYPGGRGA